MCTEVSMLFAQVNQIHNLCTQVNVSLQGSEHVSGFGSDGASSLS